MKTIQSAKHLRFVRILGIAAALSIVSNASATPKLAKFGGTYAGSYASSGNFIGFSGSSSGPSTAKFKSKQGGDAAKLSLSGTDTTNAGGGSYSATIQFKKGGACTTDAIVPGIVNVAGTGKWKVSGKTLKFNLQAATPVGVINAKASLKLSGKSLKITSNGTASSFLGSGQGQYTFQGKK